MRAIVYTQYGSADVLQLKQIVKPNAGAHEILIKVHAAEVTKADCELRSFRFPVKWFWLPLRIILGMARPRKEILGGYFAGEVESVGAKVTRFHPGDQVFGCTGFHFGAYAEYLCLPDNCTVVPKPNNMSYAEAAAVPLGALNALHFLRRAKLVSGEHVLINGAGGSIGLFAIQIAKSMGAIVTAVDKGIKESACRKAGADCFIDYEHTDFTENGESYDVIFDMVVTSRYSSCIASLNSSGRYIMGNPRLSDMLRSVLTSVLSNKNVIFAFAGEKVEELQSLKQMAEAGKIAAIIDKIYPMDQIIQAHNRVEREQRLGAIVLSLSE